MNNKTIIEKIKEKEIEMRPKWHFVLKSILIVVLAIVFLIIALYLLSFILFSFRPFPLLPFIFLLIFIVLLECLLKEFKIVYKRPIIYSILIIVFLLFAAGMCLNKAHFHEGMERRNLPGIRKFYNQSKENIRNPNIEIKPRRRL